MGVQPLKGRFMRPFLRAGSVTARLKVNPDTPPLGLDALPRQTALANRARKLCRK